MVAKLVILSIVVPFYNAVGRCEVLLRRLESIRDPDVEMVFVDDGSTDETLALLNKFSRRVGRQVKVIAQENKGPGGARNTGLRNACGQYVWFVDSDDDINIDVIGVIRSEVMSEAGSDFIDFNIMSDGSVINSMSIASSFYENGGVLLRTGKVDFGRICTKVFRREIFIDNGVFYPEYCTYEDNEVGFYIPYFVRSFKKSDMVGYWYLDNSTSITRQKLSDKFFDRLETAHRGVLGGAKLAMMSDTRDEEIYFLSDRFFKLFLLNTVIRLIRNGALLRAAKVMKAYRVSAIAPCFKINVFSHLVALRSIKGLMLIVLLIPVWVASYLLPGDSRCYLDRLRLAAWKGRASVHYSPVRVDV